VRSCAIYLAGAYDPGVCTNVTMQALLADIAAKSGGFSDWLYAGVVATSQACILAAKSCDEVRSCVAGKAAATCAKRPNISQCVGTHLHVCDKVQFEFDCATVGLDCVTMGGASNCARAASCSGPEGASCSGNDAIICMSSKTGYKGIAVSCSALGVQCIAKPNSPPGIACDIPPQDCDAKTFLPYCKGDMLIGCSKGKTRALPCALMGGVCALGPAGSKAKCKLHDSFASGPGCSGGCEGDKAQFCQSGKPVYVDCSAYGLKCEVSRCAFPSTPGP